MNILAIVTVGLALVGSLLMVGGLATALAISRFGDLQLKDHYIILAEKPRRRAIIALGVCTFGVVLQAIAHLLHI